jgi:hypothetical protein
MKRFALIVWPAMLIAPLVTAVFFSIFDPVDLSILWEPLGPSRIGAYAEAFLLFWVFGAATSALTLFFQGEVDGVAQPIGKPGKTKSKSRSRWYVTDQYRA